MDAGLLKLDVAKLLELLEQQAERIGEMEAERDQRYRELEAEIKRLRGE